MIDENMKGVKSCLGRMGTMFAVVFILFAGLYVYYEWIWEEWPPSRIERITGVRVPKYTIVNSFIGERHFTGDHEDRFEIEFKTIPSDELFDKIDQMIETGNSGWKKQGDNYSFSVFWGNGYPAPEGEYEKADGIFGITITRGDKHGEIRSGSW